MANTLLPGVTVLDLGQQVSAPYCARVFAGMGARVIKVEPPEGDPARNMGPFPGDVHHPEKSGVFLALNLNKLGVSLDLDKPKGRSKLLELVKTADILVENFEPGYMPERKLGYEQLKEVNPGLIYVSITPFGSWGPYAGYKATDLTLFHMAGSAHGLVGPVEDPESAPPLRAGGHQSDLIAGLSAATAAMIALHQKLKTGKGRHIEVSAFEAMVTQLISGLAASAYGRPAPPRNLRLIREQAVGGVVAAVGGVLPCKDGFVAISPREDAQWERWLEMMGNPAWSKEERFTTRKAREAHSRELWELLSAWTRPQSKHDIARMGQERRIPCFSVNTVADLMKNEHLRHRGFFIEVRHPVVGALEYPGVPYILSGAKIALGARPAPTLGQHNAEILEAVGAGAND
jgi:crotonobetainyl-CoA:carnitine CoA-transferase CaiB-like acyl-CoA transferase